MAIYQSTFLSPSSLSVPTIDATVINPFSSTVQGTKCTKYNAKIYKLSDNTQVYSTGDIVLSPVKYNNDVITFNLPSSTLTNGTQYKWDVTTFEDLVSITSSQVLFNANANATFTMAVPSTINTQSYTFTATYNQSNNVPLSYFYFVLSDSTGVLEKTNLIFSGNVSYQFSGFVDNNSYSIQVFGMTSNGYAFNSPIYNFITDYPQPSISIVPTISQNCNTSIVDITWGKVVVIGGSVNGGSYTYLQNYGMASNWAIELADDAVYSANIDIPELMNVRLQVKAVSFTSGKIIELVNVANNNYEFGYDNIYGRFYFKINGSYGYSEPIALPTVDFYVFLRPLDAYIKINDILYPIIAN